jgi:hypothetical protein
MYVKPIKIMKTYYAGKLIVNFKRQNIQCIHKRTFTNLYVLSPATKLKFHQNTQTALQIIMFIKNAGCIFAM